MRRTAIVPASSVRPPIARLGSTSGTLGLPNAKADVHVLSPRASITTEYFSRFLFTCNSFLMFVEMSRNPRKNVQSQIKRPDVVPSALYDSNPDPGLGKYYSCLWATAISRQMDLVQPLCWAGKRKVKRNRLKNLVFWCP